MARTALHAAALGFTAWALVATGAVDEPARDCFSGIPAHTRLRVTLGSPVVNDAAAGGDASDDSGDADAGAMDGAATADDARAPGADASAAPETGPDAQGLDTTPSCNGIDSLSAGAVLDFTLDQAERPTNATCYGWTTSRLDGVSDVSFTGSGPGWYDFGWELTAATGVFSLPGAPACQGTWSLWLGPQSPPYHGLISPLDAGAGNPWVIQRTISLPQAQFCNGHFAARGTIDCTDTFALQSLVEVP